jgi:hypothetical protein
MSKDTAIRPIDPLLRLTTKAAKETKKRNEKDHEGDKRSAFLNVF